MRRCVGVCCAHSALIRIPEEYIILCIRFKFEQRRYYKLYQFSLNMRICSSYASLWPHAVLAMLAISFASGEAPSCSDSVGNQCYSSSGNPTIPDQTMDMLVLKEQCLSACIANVRLDVHGYSVIMYTACERAKYTHT